MENQVPVPPQPQQPQDSDSRPPVPPQYNQYYQSQPVQGQPWFSQQGSQPAAPQQGTPVQPVSPQPQQGAPVQPVVPQYQQGVPMQPAMQQSQQQWGQQPVCQVPPTPQPMPIQQPAPMPQPVQGQLAPMPQPMPVQQPMPQPAPLQQPLPRAIPTPLTGPERHKVHHSYIWLGSLQLVFAMFVAVVVSSMSIFSELNFSSSGGGEGFVALLSIGGLALVLPAAFMYKKFHTFKGGILSIGVGILTSLIVSSFIGYYLIYPFYGFFFGAPIDYNAGLTLVYDAFFAKVGNYSGPYDIMICFHWILPFNLIKLCIVSVVTFIAYKPISRLRKFTDKKFGITTEISEEKKR